MDIIPSLVDFIFWMGGGMIVYGWENFISLFGIIINLKNGKVMSKLSRKTKSEIMEMYPGINFNGGSTKAQMLVMVGEYESNLDSNSDDPVIGGDLTDVDVEVEEVVEVLPTEEVKADVPSPMSVRDMEIARNTARGKMRIANLGKGSK